MFRRDPLRILATVAVLVSLAGASLVISTASAAPPQKQRECGAAFGGDQPGDLTKSTTPPDGSEVVIGETIEVTFTWQTEDWEGLDKLFDCLRVYRNGKVIADDLSVYEEIRPENDGTARHTYKIPSEAGGQQLRNGDRVCDAGRLSGSPVGGDSEENPSTHKSAEICFTVASQSSPTTTTTDASTTTTEAATTTTEAPTTTTSPTTTTESPTTTTQAPTTTTEAATTTTQAPVLTIAPTTTTQPTTTTEAATTTTEAGTTTTQGPTTTTEGPTSTTEAPTSTTSATTTTTDPVLGTTIVNSTTTTTTEPPTSTTEASTTTTSEGVVLPSTTQPGDGGGDTEGPNPDQGGDPGDEVEAQEEESDDILPFTGSEPGPIVLIGGLFIVAGAAVLLGNRRGRQGS